MLLLSDVVAIAPVTFTGVRSPCVLQYRNAAVLVPIIYTVSGRLPEIESRQIGVWSGVDGWFDVIRHDPSLIRTRHVMAGIITSEQRLDDAST